MQTGPLRGELALSYRITDPSRRRSVVANVTVVLTLDAGAPFVRIGIRGENRSENHRVRLLLRTDVVGGVVYADAAFGTVQRERVPPGGNGIRDLEAKMEIPPPTAPLHRYVSRFDDDAGFTIFSDGLAEYEASDDGAVLVTLVRAVGELSRNDLPERPGHAGWPVPTPGAQWLGPFEAEFAVMPHGPRDPATIDRIERAADDVLNPLVGITLRSALRVPAPVHGVELVGQGLAFSTVKQSERDGWLVLRCFNLLESAVDGEWRLPFEILEARNARLDETVMSPLEPAGRVVRFRAAARAIVTVLVR
jgi:mannosylglycerate hydrolase